MRSLANTTISIENTKQLDPDYDEPIDGSDSTVGGPYPASLIERRIITADPSDNDKPTFLRYAVLRLRSNIVIEVDNIIVDQKTSKRWIVEEVTQLFNPMTGMDLRCQLRRLSS